MKSLVILHSNDIHGDFDPKDKDGISTGGLSRLSGYVRGVRESEKNVIYAIGGDMFMGSIIDMEYRGLSTIKLANALEPDVFAVGNHEVDYGLTHLLFLEKCSDFPIICANMYVKELNRRLFMPWVDIVRDGVRVRFVGLLTESVYDRIRQEELVDTTVSVRDVKKELGRVFSEMAGSKADVTVLLTHIGIEEDKKLASELDPAWGVDLIIGAHSHTRMEEPLIINGIPIVQAGSGSGQIGRFDLTVNDEGHLADWKWQCLPIDETVAGTDILIDFYRERMQDEIDKEYEKVLVTFPQAYTHPGFHRETQLIDLVADIYRDAFGTDIFIFSSNAIRCKTLGPKVTKKDLMMALPYDCEVYRLRVDGHTFERIIRHLYRKTAWEGTSVYFLFSGTLRVDFDRDRWEVIGMALNGEPIDPEREYTIGFTAYAYDNMANFLGITQEEAGDRVRRIAANDREAVEDYFARHDRIALTNEGRLNILTPSEAAGQRLT